MHELRVSVEQVPADVRRQLTSATGRQNVKRMLSILHSLELVEPAQRDEDSVAFTFKHLKASLWCCVCSLQHR